MQMVLISSRVFLLIFLHITFEWSLIFCLSSDELREISCLRSIKDSLEDPLNYLTWSFDDREAAASSFCKFKGVECWNGHKLAILTIELGDMGLKGQFPRGIENCKSLTGLNLTGNDIFGPIPLELCQELPFLTTLDLSHNNFSGEIPSTMAHCKYLNVLKLNDNKLTGQIPGQLGQLQRLKTLSLAHNQLSGEVPHFLGYHPTQDTFANNKGLCGEPLKPCRTSDRFKFDYSFTGGFLIGYVFATVSVTTFSICYLCFRYMWKDKK